MLHLATAVSQVAMGRCRGEKEDLGRKEWRFLGESWVFEGGKGLRGRFCMGKSMASKSREVSLCLAP